MNLMSNKAKAVWLLVAVIAVWMCATVFTAVTVHQDPEPEWRVPGAVPESMAPASVAPVAPITSPRTVKTATQPAPTAAFFRNCDEAKAAGVAPIRRGEPGYRSALDRDGDGIACDK